MKVISEDEIMNAYIESNPNLWVREVHHLLQRRGFYFYETPLPNHDLGSIYRFEVLITHTTPFTPNENCTVKISSLAVTGTGGPDFPLFSYEYKVKITPPENEVNQCEWSMLENKFIKKAFEITKSANTVAVEANIVN
ncbi:MAG: hypothetical protein P8014_13775 [Acidihalobacter sp.]|uniref:hypothetical protein n=1 Tax=Acidihalobacter sp. TaxID=1872108 RepID=UPI00307F476F